MRRARLFAACVFMLTTTGADPIYAAEADKWTGAFAGVALAVDALALESREYTERSTHFVSQSSGYSISFPGAVRTDFATTTTTIQTSAMRGIGPRSWGVGGGGEVLIGANWQLARRLVVGAQLEGGYVSTGVIERARRNTHESTSTSSVTVSSNASTGTVVSSINSSSSSSYNTATEQNWSKDWRSSATARVGWLMNDQVLFYGTIGWTAFRILQADCYYYCDAYARFVHGPLVGSGLEVRVNDYWSVRAEYRLATSLQLSIRSEKQLTSSSTSSGSSSHQIESARANKTVDLEDHAAGISIIYHFR